MISFTYKFNKKQCPLCTEGKNCGFKFPTQQDFEFGGKFSHIKFPISEKKFPNDLFSYIFPNNWNEYSHVPFHNNYYIIRTLNEIKFCDA